MKPFTLIAISVLLAAFIYSCGEKDTSTADIYNINLTEGYTDTTLHLEDFAEDVRLIRLETNKQCLVNRLRGHIGGKHIVVMGRENMLHFSADDGSYIGKITQKGKGPHEFDYIEAWAVDKNEQSLIYHNRGGSNITRYNMEDHKFEEFVPLATEKDVTDLGNIVFVNDTLLAVKRGMFSACQYQYFYQTTTGRFIKGRKKEPIPHPGGWAGSSPVFKKATDNSIIFQPFESDSIFQINGTDIELLAVFQNKSPGRDGDYTINHHGVFLYGGRNRLFLRENNFKTQITPNSSRFKIMEPGYFFSNLNDNQLYRIKSLYYDDLGLELKDYNLRFPHKNLFVIHYQAMEFKDMIREQLKNGDIPVAKRKKLKQLNGKITENDNPIIITGKCI